MSDKDFDEHVKDFEYYTYNNYNDEYLEVFYDEYTTKSGETIVAFGKYGYDGWIIKWCNFERFSLEKMW